MIRRILLLWVIAGISMGSFSQSIGKKKLKVPVSHSGVSRVRAYDVSHPDIPAAFKNFRIAFVSDLHYKSKFKEKGLASLTRMLRAVQPDLILLGGDYLGECRYMRELFDSIASVHPTFGIAGVMGNHDYGACYDTLVQVMKEQGIRLLEHEVMPVKRDTSEIYIAGVRNPFNLKINGNSPAQEVDSAAYVILLTHTPDYVEDVDNSHADLALAGHTHGGQVTFFGWFAPRIPSHYKQRFRTGLKRSTQNVPIIITNGVGTSRKNIRAFAPSEIVVLDLQ